MSRVKTLEDIAGLEWSRFGRPKPRHGLKLLFWFANDCLSFDHNDMILECDPESREFGFHYFSNRNDSNGDRLLPDVDLPYYLLGNLNSLRANELPGYVRENYTGQLDNSNMDRIIVSVDGEWIERVYVTEHDDQTNFNPEATYRISQSLLKIISTLEFNDFLRQTGYQREPQCLPPEPIRSPPRNQDYQIETNPAEENDNSSVSSDKPIIRRRRNRCCGCTIL